MDQNEANYILKSKGVYVPAFVMAFSSLLFILLQYGCSFLFPEGSNSSYALAGIIISGGFFALMSKVAAWGAPTKGFVWNFRLLFLAAWILGVIAEGVYLVAPHDPNDFTVTENYLLVHDAFISRMRFLSALVGVLTVLDVVFIAVYTRTVGKHSVALLAICLMWLACSASILADFLSLPSDMVVSSTLFALAMAIIVRTVYQTKGLKWPFLLVVSLLVVGSFVVEYLTLQGAPAQVEEVQVTEEELLLEDMEAAAEEEGFAEEYVEEEGFVEEAPAEDYSEEEGFVDE